MNKKTITTFLLILLTLSFMSVVVIGSKKNNSIKQQTKQAQIQEIEPDTNSAESNHIEHFYWATTCPFCHDVMEWMDTKEIHKKITVERKEIHKTEDNKKDLIEKAKSCGIDENDIGIPFMYTSDGNCLTGYPEIIAYLENKIVSIEPINNSYDLEGSDI